MTQTADILRKGHTPGPWKAIKAAHGPIDVFDDRDRDIVTVFSGGVGIEDQEANARLIAASPELLEILREAHITLKAASRQLTEDHRMILSGRAWGWKTLARIEGAIAKAEGRDA